ncbi:nuclease-related domain-containing protein [Halalkalibacter alkaliphilus]|uniref:nuclease-related domain-containing protein n=1 Tax=Halalkalibacter alkaliphilus TaxID=2917993 RepID=UPI003084166B
MNLSDKDKQYYFYLEKGFDGEKAFDLLTENLQCECLIVNDLLLKQNNTLFQIDSLIITQESVYLFEVKNYEGDYYYDSEGFYKIPNSEITNPFNQLIRSESLLRRLFQNLGFNLPIHASVVFINPQFTLYQTPLNIPFVFPTQINRYLSKLNTTPSKLNPKHKLLADKLISLHITDSPFKMLPTYDYDLLQKGITCAKCTSFSIAIEGRKCVCKECWHEEAFAGAVLRSAREYKLLFPYRRITTNEMYNWCIAIDSKRRISKVLQRNLKKLAFGNGLIMNKKLS